MGESHAKKVLRGCSVAHVLHDGIVDSSGVRSILDKHLGGTATPIRQRLAWHVAMATEGRAFAIEQVVGAATSAPDGE